MSAAGRFGMDTSSKMLRIANVARFGVLAALMCAWTGGVLAQGAAAPYTTGYRYDNASRLVGTIQPDPDGAGPINFAAVRNTYNAQGMLSRVEKGELASWQSENTVPSAWSGFTVFQQTDYTYDNWGRKLTEKVSGVVSGTATPYTLTQYTYDSSGRVQCVAQRLNTAAFGALPASACTLGTEGTQGPDRITNTSYDVLSRPLQVVKAFGTSVQYTYATYTYYLNGPLQSTTDANGNYSYYTYDTLVRLSNFYFPSKTTAGQYSTTDYEQYGYDLNGNRTSLTKRDGNTINYAYDNLSRLTHTIYPAGTVADVWYNYDLRNLQLTALLGTNVSSGTTGISRTYDGFGRVATATNNLSGASWQLSYQYDGEGNRLRITHPDSTYFTYTYDGLNRATQVFESGTTLLATITYDNQGRRQTLSRGASVTSTGYAYDPVSRVQTLTQNLDGAGTTNDVTFGFTYSPASQVTTRTLSNGAYGFINGPSTSQLLVPNGLNQYTSIFGSTTVSPAYDPNGNMTWDGSTTYTYDVENRLIGATGGRTATLIYDPLGHLYETNSSGNGVTRFIYDGDALVAEYSSAGAVLNRYVHGPGVDEPIVWYSGSTVGSASRNYMHADRQGSIIALTGSTGATNVINTYDPYGIPGSGNHGRFQYTGQTLVPELQLYYYKARIYNPRLGRFMQSDPIGYKDDVDLYTYVGNDPLDQSDPSGKCFGSGWLGGGFSLFCPKPGDSEKKAALDKTASANQRGGMFSGAGASGHYSTNSSTANASQKVKQLGQTRSGDSNSGSRTAASTTAAAAGATTAAATTSSSGAAASQTTRAFWVGPDGLAAAQSSGSQVLQLSPGAQSALSAGDPALMIQESSAWAAGAVGPSADVFIGTGAGLTFYNYELPQLIENLNLGTLGRIAITF
jgi:RHS repeat-associated protein